MRKAILTGVLCVGMASAAYARDKGFSLPVPPGIPKQLVPGAKGSWLPTPPAPPLASWDHVRAPGIGRVPVLVPDFDRHDRHGYRHSRGHVYGHIGAPVYVPRPVVVAPPVYVPRPVVCAPVPVYAPAPVVYAPPPVVYAPAPVVVAPSCGPRYYSTTSFGGYYSNSGLSIGFSIGR